MVVSFASHQKQSMKRVRGLTSNKMLKEMRRVALTGFLWKFWKSQLSVLGCCSRNVDVRVWLSRFRVGCMENCVASTNAIWNSRGRFFAGNIANKKPNVSPHSIGPLHSAVRYPIVSADSESAIQTSQKSRTVGHSTDNVVIIRADACSSSQYHKARGVIQTVAHRTADSSKETRGTAHIWRRHWGAGSQSDAYSAEQTRRI